MIAALLGSLGGKLLEGLFGVVEKAVPDRDLAEKLKAQFQAMVMGAWLAELQAAVSTITTEMSGNWLQRSWRPLTMMTFLSMVVSYWYGLAGRDLPPELVKELFELIKIGLGGYVVGRSAEKVIPPIVAALRK